MSMRAAIAEQYGEKVLRKSSMNIREGAGVFEKVLGGRQYKTVLEIGTYRGIGAAELSQYCEKVITIDLLDGKLEGNGESFDREGLWRSLGINNIELHLVKDDREKASLIDRLEFDFAFIDGAHDQGVELDWRLTKKCGAVLFHDYYKHADGRKSWVYDLVNRLPKHQVQVLDIFAFWRNDSR